jgi:CRISPR-associated protein Csx14
MIAMPAPAIQIHVDPTNPGQFFGCCGLLELADRLWSAAEGWFERTLFSISTSNSAADATLGGLLATIASADLQQVDGGDDFSSPVELRDPFSLHVDWWKDSHAGGSRLKVWAGSMRSVRITRAMQTVLQRPELADVSLFDRAMLVYDPREPDKKVEPFYFDARRGASAQPIDIGFSPDSLQMTTAAYPAVEFLCLVGLQRCRPMPTDTPRVFDYHTWNVPLSPPALPAAICGLLPHVGGRGFRFENAFRTDQRKHKAFTPATPLPRS